MILYLKANVKVVQGDEDKKLWYSMTDDERNKRLEEIKQSWHDELSAESEKVSVDTHVFVVELGESE